MPSPGRAVALTAVAAFILLIPTLQNGFPFVMNDTWAYVHTGMSYSVVWDRPALYGLFLHASSLGLTLWLSVIVQALITVGVTRMAFRLLTPALDPGFAALVTLAILTATTAMGIDVGLLLPDVFAPLIFLILALILVAPAALTTRRDLAILGVVLVMGCTSHLAHLSAAALVVVGALVYRLTATRLRLPQIAWRRLGLAAGLVTASWVTVPTVHALLGGGFTLAPGSPAFIVARMAENGVLSDFLKEACPHRGWKLCDQQDKIPADTSAFLWGGGDSSPLRRNGGATPANLKEYRQIFWATMRKPRWLARQLGEATIATMRQAVLIDPTAVIYHQPLMDLIATKIKIWFPGDHGEYLHSRQITQTQTMREWLPRLNDWAVLGSLALLLVIFARRDLRAAVRPQVLLVTIFLAMGLVANAGVCGGLSVPHDRYQARVVPLIPLLVAMLLAHPRMRAALLRRARELFS